MPNFYYPIEGYLNRLSFFQCSTNCDKRHLNSFSKKKLVRLLSKTQDEILKLNNSLEHEKKLFDLVKKKNDALKAQNNTLNTTVFLIMALAAIFFILLLISLFCPLLLSSG